MHPSVAAATRSFVPTIETPFPGLAAVSPGCFPMLGRGPGDLAHAGSVRPGAADFLRDSSAGRAALLPGRRGPFFLLLALHAQGRRERSLVDVAQLHQRLAEALAVGLLVLERALDLLLAEHRERDEDLAQLALV